MKSKKGMLIVGIVIAALCGWGIWYQFIREKTVGEKIEEAGKDMGRSMDKMIDKIK